MPGIEVNTYIYRRKDCDKTNHVVSGDWLKRDKSLNTEGCTIF